MLVTNVRHTNMNMTLYWKQNIVNIMLVTQTTEGQVTYNLMHPNLLGNKRTYYVSPIATTHSWLQKDKLSPLAIATIRLWKEKLLSFIWLWQDKLYFSLLLLRPLGYVIPPEYRRTTAE